MATGSLGLIEEHMKAESKATSPSKRWRENAGAENLFMVQNLPI